jgi:adenylate cyclase
MLASLEDFNQSLADRGLPSLSLRAGISSGRMVVGDTGSEDAGSYTVLGDTVNFGSRLESANKALGTEALLSRRTVELIGDEFLVRPVGLIQVVGKTEGVLTYEVLNRSQDATLEQKRLAEISGRAIDAFIGRRFADCLAALAELEREFGSSKFISFYRELAERYLREPPGDDFDGKVVLTEK